MVSLSLSLLALALGSFLRPLGLGLPTELKPVFSILPFFPGRSLSRPGKSVCWGSQAWVLCESRNLLTFLRRPYVTFIRKHFSEGKGINMRGEA
jgi:hypothetical protein